jgi:hypothetical protein
VNSRVLVGRHKLFGKSYCLHFQHYLQQKAARSEGNICLDKLQLPACPHTEDIKNEQGTAITFNMGDPTPFEM